MTNSAFDLGMVGLVQFLPTAILTFAAGHAADRYDRRRVVQVCEFTQALTAGFLAWGTLGGWITVPEIFAAVAVLGTATAFESPAVVSLLPAVVPEGMLQRGTAASTGSFQVAVISGPAVGGFAYGVSPVLPYAAIAAFWFIAGIMTGAIRLQQSVEEREPPSFDALFAGVGFVRANPAILGTISLDLFAVLLGGATALLPIYARDILHTGPVGLGMLRGAPALGALCTAVILSRHPITRRAGMRMFQAVIIFGLATIAFAVSNSFWVSIVVLAVMGGADAVSVVIRLSLVQNATPDEMRGRVNAVNYLFVNASNELGEFESGISAALLGPILAATVGGIGTLIVALLWMRLFPTLRNVERLE